MSTFIDIITLRHFWFLRAYILLMIMAPALNLLAEHSSKVQFGTILIVFFLFQTIFSYINNSPWYQDGFSALPFFGLYLLARYLRIYGNPIPNKYISFILYLLVSAIIAAIALFFMIRFGTQGRMFNYTNPLVILSSILLFLCFTAFRFESRFVNWVASSVFAVYLFHMNPFFFDNYFIKTIQPWSGDSFLLFEGKSLLFIIVIFIAAILLDKVRMWLWQRLLSLKGVQSLDSKSAAYWPVWFSLNRALNSIYQGHPARKDRLRKLRMIDIDFYLQYDFREESVVSRFSRYLMKKNIKLFDFFKHAIKSIR